MNSDQEFFERRIVTGMIVSKDYLDRIHKFWDSTLLESPELKMIADWCMDYYEKYNRAPDSNIESIYMASLKGNFLSKAEAPVSYTHLDVYKRQPFSRAWTGPYRVHLRRHSTAAGRN